MNAALGTRRLTALVGTRKMPGRTGEPNGRSKWEFPACIGPDEMQMREKNKYTAVLIVLLLISGCDRKLQEHESLQPSPQSQTPKTQKQESQQPGPPAQSAEDVGPQEITMEIHKVSPLARARLALELEKQGKYREALILLKKVDDADLVIPGRMGISDIADDGTYIGEWEPPYSIGNRRLSMMRCYLQLGKPREAISQAWHLVEAESVESSVYICIAKHLELQGGYGAILERLEDLQKKKSIHRGAKWCLEYVRAEHDLSIRHFDDVVLRISSANSLRSIARGPKASLKEHLARSLARRGAAVPHLIKALGRHSQPTWIVYSLGLSGDERAIAPLFRYLLSTSNHHERQEAVVALSRLGARATAHAIALLRSKVPSVRETGALVLSECPPNTLKSADPGLTQIFAALRDKRNHVRIPHVVNIPVFLLRAVASTKDRKLIPNIRRLRAKFAKLDLNEDLNYMLTLGHLGDMSVVPDLIRALGGTYPHFVRPALEDATGKSFRTQSQWQEWWLKTGSKEKK